MPSRMPHGHGVVLRQKYGLILRVEKGVCPTSAISLGSLFFFCLLTGVV